MPGVVVVDDVDFGGTVVDGLVVVVLGAITSAASTGELLRCYTEDILDLAPPHANPDPAATVTVTPAVRIATKR